MDGSAVWFGSSIFFDVGQAVQLADKAVGAFRLLLYLLALELHQIMPIPQFHLRSFLTWGAQ